jgi:DNA polymerase elongation subunit (family B)
LDPEGNTIVTAGVFDGKETSVYPIIQDLRKENEPLQFLLRELERAGSSVLVGYNILHFDIPYLVHKSRSIGRDFDSTRLKLLDLYWILPYWLHNTPSGQEFFNRNSTIGNLWRFENVVKLILKEGENPIPNKDVHRLYEAKRFQDIERHLKLDLLHTFSFLKSETIQESLDQIRKHRFDKRYCEESCPFQRPLLKTPSTMIGYCTLLQEATMNERETSTIDVICCSLPQRDVSWVPRCSEAQRAPG